MKAYQNAPDWRNLARAARNEWVPRVPLYEHIVGAKVIYEITGNRPYDGMFSPHLAESREAFQQYWDFWRRMGYDTASMEFAFTGILPGAGALGGHKEGAIKTREDFERYPWEELPERFFARYAPYIRAFSQAAPQGMMAVGGVGNGVFESVQDIVGYMDLCFIREDDPELYAGLFQRMGEAQCAVWKRFMEEFADAFCVLRFGDDLGFHTATLLPHDDIRAHILPVYRRITDMVHAKGKPFLLHSCGNLFAMFDDIIELGGIDAKHSNEDSIAPFPVWVEKYGDRIGNFGGIDTDVLCRYDESYIRKYVFDCLDAVKGHGGIAFSSGNSIPDYVPTAGYLAMIEAVRDWRGDPLEG